MSASRLPRFAEWLLRHAIADPVAREGVLGDMREEYTAFTGCNSSVVSYLSFSLIALGMAMRFTADRVRNATHRRRPRRMSGLAHR